MKVITEQELVGNFAVVMDAVEAGETFRISRNGVSVAELRPFGGQQRVSADELVMRHAQLPQVDHRRLRSEADEFFRGEERVDVEDGAPDTMSRP